MRSVPTYAPVNTLDANRYAIAPFQKKALRLDGVDRSQGELQQSWQGRSIYIESCDFPFLFSLITQDGNLESAVHVAHAGYQLEGLFRGVYVYHPLLSLAVGPPMGARVIIGVNDDDLHVSNQFAYPFGQSPPGCHVTANTAVAFGGYLALPPGTKHIAEVSIAQLATTITTATLQIAGGAAGGTIYEGPTYTDIRGTVFDQQLIAQTIPDIVTVPGGFKVRELNWPVPTNSSVLIFAFAGTGMSGIMADKGVKLVLA